MAQLYAKDITPDDKQELDEALQREVGFITKFKVVYALLLLYPQLTCLFCVTFKLNFKCKDSILGMIIVCFKFTNVLIKNNLINSFWHCSKIRFDLLT